METLKNPRFLVSALIALLILGLGGWFLYLRFQTGSIEEVDAGRGLGTAAPSFGGSGGSTIGNIVSGLGFSTQAQPGGARVLGRMELVQATPIAGYGFVGSGSTAALRFMERSTGYVFQVALTEGAAERLSNSLIPKIYDASFTPDGSVVATALDTEGRALVFTGILGVSTSTDTLAPLQQTALGEGILATEPGKTTNQVLSLVETSSGASLVRSGLDKTNPEELISLGILGWRVLWLRDNTIFIYQHPASGVLGSAYQVSRGTLLPVARNVPGLTILPRASSTAVIIGSDDGTLSLFGRTADDATTVVLPVRTVAEKCVWAPSPRGSSGGNGPFIAYCAVPESVDSRSFLDEWYRGTLHTADSWWKVDVGANSAELLYSPQTELNATIDVEDPIVDNEGNYIVFRNAIDKSLWMLRIKE